MVDRVFMIAVYVLLTTFLLAVLLPLLYILASSFSSPLAVSSGRVSFWPIDFTLEGYERALGDSTIVTGFANSLFYTAAGTFVSLALTVAIAYPLSRKDFWGRGGITLGVIFTMLFAGGIIPTYLVVQQLGLLDTRWALILPQAVGVWQVIIAVVFFRSSIPDELYEAAQLDGASDLRFLWTIVLPLSKPLLAVVALMYAIYQWNSYFDALLYLRDPSLYPLQLVLRNVLILNQATPGMDAAAQIERQQLADLLKYSLIVISTVPVMILYPFVARYFNKGIMLGAVKG
ncbi:putative aldouronate transport system permease protein [Rathayibacter sp. PhB93]|uniref:ABC transporter permease subunit n=2 Tax=Microbacteriaceae TaxID=85023 RepID=A0ABX6H563_9MICO|nr:ABC transporter permease subunit [Rathayibacter festucae]ROP48163.1 putative aldouronate transport system permease protein [Rathayibacter sp. PhB186]ROQ05692.1 putative aldouronate transport system permease protein [Rathayibacter sp. PhB93]ROS48651.1 putative aldouronate transport system permease protein [Rathayibacter sp. PhB185]TCL82678.1 putative aldouronate transport system permease protein [Rathayibacter sp. PhB192]TCM28017.1 putative aldouronate transport system permease protein [Rath